MSMGIRHWMVRVLAWDGLLPACVILAGMLVRFLSQDEVLAGCVGAILLPLSATIIRSHIALGQVKQVCGGEAPVLRQIAIAAAIVSMLLFEVSVNGMALADHVPLEAWSIVGAFYLLYLGFIAWALRPDGRCAAAGAPVEIEAND